MIVWQSIIFEDGGVQLSYYLEEERNESGMLIRTAVINPIDLKPELEDLFDSANQLVAAWEAMRRQVPVPGPRS